MIVVSFGKWAQWQWATNGATGQFGFATADGALRAAWTFMGLGVPALIYTRRVK